MFLLVRKKIVGKILSIEFKQPSMSLVTIQTSWQPRWNCANDVVSQLISLAVQQEWPCLQMFLLVRKKIGGKILSNEL
jgi:hypothetical protein